MMHSLGFYIMSAVTNSIGAAFNGRSHRSTYPKEPIFKKYFDDMNLTEEERLERDMKLAIASEDAWMARTKTHFKETDA